VFRTLGELVNHYKYDSDGLCLCLTDFCKKSELPQTADLSHNTKDQVRRCEYYLILQVFHCGSCDFVPFSS
jgi:hypothetical protein